MDVDKLIRFHGRFPLSLAPDVVGIKKHFELQGWTEFTLDKRFMQEFCIMWMLREPARVDAYMEGGLTAAEEESRRSSRGPFMRNAPEAARGEPLLQSADATPQFERCPQGNGRQEVTTAVCVPSAG